VRSAIQITTAGGICAVLDMLATGKLPQSGLIRQEDIKLPAFLANRFGRFYALPPAGAATSLAGVPTSPPAANAA
jgi:saccharopine dehydrogenase-like NADP-dependent oxidoreductase